MIRLEEKGVRLGLSFSHHKVEDDPKVQRRTVCQVFNLDLNQELAVGEALCSKLDTFVKSKGRKLALARAICQHEFEGGKPKHWFCIKCGSPEAPYLELSKELRTKIWLTYFDSLTSRLSSEVSGASSNENIPGQTES